LCNRRGGHCCGGYRQNSDVRGQSDDQSRGLQDGCVAAGSGKGTDRKTYSLELCGGTHVSRTGDIGMFILLGDSASSAGVRRIEALTGEAALRHVESQQEALTQAAKVAKAPPRE